MDWNLLFSFLAAVTGIYAIYFMHCVDAPKIEITAGSTSESSRMGKVVTGASCIFFISNNGRRAITIDKFILEIGNSKREPGINKSRLDGYDKVIAIKHYESFEEITKVYMIDTTGKHWSMKNKELSKVNKGISAIFA